MSQASAKPRRLAALETTLSPLYHLAPPHLEGLEHVSAERPALYVCNHSSPYALDIFALYLALKKERGIALQALAHRLAFKIPLVAQQMNTLGIFEGNRANCSRLMEQGEHILVFPGGGRELMKAKGHKYQLAWANRLGFVRMAIKHGYPIIPVAKLGGEDHYDIWYDKDDLGRTRVGQLLQKLGVPLDLPPLVKGWGGSPLPIPQRYAIKFMPAIDTLAYAGQEGDDATCLAVQQQAAASLSEALRDLEDYQDVREVKR